MMNFWNTKKYTKPFLRNLESTSGKTIGSRTKCDFDVDVVGGCNIKNIMAAAHCLFSFNHPV